MPGSTPVAKRRSLRASPLSWRVPMALTFDPTDPFQMTAGQRMEEITSLLAAGFHRLRCRGTVPTTGTPLRVTHREGRCHYKIRPARRTNRLGSDSGAATARQVPQMDLGDSRTRARALCRRGLYHRTARTSADRTHGDDGEADRFREFERARPADEVLRICRPNRTPRRRQDR